MADDRVPYNDKYCKATNCHWRSGNKCTVASCLRLGNEKRSHYYTKKNKLAHGDVPE